MPQASALASSSRGILHRHVFAAMMPNIQHMIRRDCEPARGRSLDVQQEAEGKRDSRETGVQRDYGRILP